MAKKVKEVYELNLSDSKGVESNLDTNTNKDKDNDTQDGKKPFDAEKLALAYNVPVFIIELAKLHTYSENEEKIKEWLKEHKGKNLNITF